MRSLPCLVFAFLLSGNGLLPASPSPSSVDPRNDGTQPSTSLPAWGETDCSEAFDVRLWPESTVLWLEQENLRDLIADPSTPEPDREQFRRILAMQQAWK